MKAMTVAPEEQVILRVPRSSLSGLLVLPDALKDRMHHLLERNTDGDLSPSELAELERLVEMFHFGQLLSLTMRAGELK